MILQLYRNDSGWRWRLLASNGKVIGASTEGYKRRASMVWNLHDVTTIIVPERIAKTLQARYFKPKLSLRVSVNNDGQREAHL